MLCVLQAETRHALPLYVRACLLPLLIDLAMVCHKWRHVMHTMVQQRLPGDWPLEELNKTPAGAPAPHAVDDHLATGYACCMAASLKWCGHCCVPLLSCGARRDARFLFFLSHCCGLHVQVHSHAGSPLGLHVQVIP